MMYAIQWLRSLLFIGQMYLAMFVMALFFIPMTMIKRENSYWAVRSYCRWVRWTASWMVGLKSEVRGEVPTDEVLIASKHQSFFDIILIVSAVPRPKFIMKAVLKWAPILGWFALKIGCVPVERGKRGAAIKQMVADVKSGAQLPGQLIIFPQGTRVAAGAHLPYKVGAAVLHQQTGQPVVPAATNVGVFWPRHGIYRKPGLAVVEFLPRLDAEDLDGMETGTITKVLEEAIEPASNRLMAEAGFVVDATKHQSVPKA
ncbi:lysophospholipid acyltransferase family protein [Neptunicoccus sediminis]|uniref:lysophospholipid acyltransferase family protein n=1 Tax=Neptunicoccus sediminis TaxID=1892596 RepID=UPI000846027F|nr:lysophospholipid acyltransferase family protein [Neptunicoccus sediminis]